MSRRPSSHTGDCPNGAQRPVEGSLRRPTPAAGRGPPGEPATSRRHGHPLNPADLLLTKGTAMTDRRRGAQPGSHKHLTIADVCAELDVARSIFYDWRARRVAPPCIKLPNGELRVRRADLDAWLSAHEEAA